MSQRELERILNQAKDMRRTLKFVGAHRVDEARRTLERAGVYHVEEAHRTLERLGGHRAETTHVELAHRLLGSLQNSPAFSHAVTASERPASTVTELAVRARVALAAIDDSQLLEAAQATPRGKLWLDRPVHVSEPLWKDLIRAFAHLQQQENALADQIAATLGEQEPHSETLGDEAATTELPDVAYQESSSKRLFRLKGLLKGIGVVFVLVMTTDYDVVADNLESMRDGLVWLLDILLEIAEEQGPFEDGKTSR